MISGIERFRKMIRNWWVALLVGILICGVGVLVFFYPGEAYLTLSVLFGFIILFSGIAQIIIGSGAPTGTGRGWLIAAGILEVILALMLMFNWGISAMILPFFLGFWLIFRGVVLIGMAVDMNRAGIRGNGWTIAAAILLILCAILILINPYIGAGALVVFLGIGFLMAGITAIIYAFQLLRLKKDLKLKGK